MSRSESEPYRIEIDDAPVSKLKVTHNIEDIKDGDTIEFTLADQTILDGKKLNSGIDKLQNEAMARDQRAEFNQQLIKKLRGEIDPEEALLEGRILPQYDDLKYEKDGFMINPDEETSGANGSNQLQDIYAKLGIKKRDFFDLNMEKKVADEFMTIDEFKGRKKKKDKTKKAKPADFSFLKQLESEAITDIGKRNTTSLNMEDELIEGQKKKLKIYADTINKETQKARKNINFEEQFISNEDDEREELEKLIFRTNRMAADRGKNADERLQAVLNGENPQHQKSRFELMQTESQPDDQIEFGDEDETYGNLKDCLEESKKESLEIRKNFSLMDQANGRASIIDVMLPSERLKYGLAFKAEEEEKALTKNESNEETPTQLKDEPKDNQETPQPENVHEVIEEEEDENYKDLVDMTNSTAAFMRMFKKKGMLKKDNYLTYNGRGKDVMPHKEIERVGGDPNSKINFEYRDAKTGLLNTPKEEFRKIGHSFHNIKPSKKKQAKTMKRLKAREKQINTNPTEYKSYVLMKAYQDQTNLPYVDLSDRGKK